MSANIAFLAGNGIVIQDLSGSGLGFYGSGGFGASVKVGSWQGRTFITDGGGTSLGPEVNNVQYLNAQSGVLGQTGSGLGLRAIPNYQSTLNIRFTYDSPVKTQNGQVIIYDRTDIIHPASGVTTMVAELLHPSITQVNNGSGNTVWSSLGGSGSVLNITPSPGVSGLYAGNGNDGNWTDKEHDWYFAISASPLSIGSKSLYGLYCSLEYL